MSLSDKLNPSLRNLPVYQPGRPIEEVARELGLERDEVIKVASNENPLGPSPLAVEAMKTAVTQSHLYPDGNAFYLKNKLAAKLGVEPANLIFGNGSNEIIEFVSHALLGSGRRDSRVTILLRHLPARRDDHGRQGERRACGRARA